MMEKKESQEEQRFDRITVYTPPGLKEEIDAYCREKGYGTRSEMFRKAYQILRYIFPSGKEVSDTPTLHEKLNELNARTEEIKLSLEALHVERTLLDAKINNHRLEHANIAEVAEEVLTAIADPSRFNGSVKDFIIQEYFAEKYSPGIIFQALLRLVNQKKLKEVNGLYEVRK